VVSEQAGIAVLDCTRSDRTEREQEQNPLPQKDIAGWVTVRVEDSSDVLLISPDDAKKSGAKFD
jgi:hypothetical protein